MSVRLWCVVLVAFALWMRTGDAAATTLDPNAPSSPSEAQRALNEANLALAAKPVRSDDARRALDHAVAAGVDSLAVAEAYFRLGALDEEDGMFASALTSYGECIARMPGSHWARSARKRVTWLNERSEGDFAPLAQLQRSQRNPALANDPAALDAFAREVDGFPPGMVRGEARMLVAEAWLKDMDRPQNAVREFRKVVDDPKANPRTSVFAERDLVAEWLAEGKLDEAANEIRMHPLDPRLVKQVQQLVHERELWRWAAIATTVLVCIAFVAIALSRHRRRAETVRTPTTVS